MNAIRRSGSCGASRRRRDLLLNLLLLPHGVVACIDLQTSSRGAMNGTLRNQRPLDEATEWESCRSRNEARGICPQQPSSQRSAQGARVRDSPRDYPHECRCPASCLAGCRRVRRGGGARWYGLRRRLHPAISTAHPKGHGDRLERVDRTPRRRLSTPRHVLYRLNHGRRSPNA